MRAEDPVDARPDFVCPLHGAGCRMVPFRSAHAVNLHASICSDGVSAAATAATCTTSGCGRRTWNGEAGTACCRTCAESARSAHGPVCEQNTQPDAAQPDALICPLHSPGCPMGPFSTAHAANLHILTALDDADVQHLSPGGIMILIMNPKHF